MGDFKISMEQIEMYELQPYDGVWVVQRWSWCYQPPGISVNKFSFCINPIKTRCFYVVIAYTEKNHICGLADGILEPFLADEPLTIRGLINCIGKPNKIAVRCESLENGQS